MLTTVQGDDGMWYVQGVVPDESVRAPLGRHQFRVGAHLVGFDDRFAEPLVVRAYHDLTLDAAAREAHERNAYQFLGYMQFCQLTFRSQWIRPAVLGGRLADRDPYVHPETGYFVDFMGPQDEQLRYSTAVPPFYPYNAVLLDGNLRDIQDFTRHPLVNGSMWSAPTGSASQSLCASLCAEVAPGLVTPEAITPYLTEFNRLGHISVSPQDLADREAYRIALDLLKTSALPPDTTPPLQGLDESQVLAQVIGGYVLLTLPDPEDAGSTLCISTGSGTDGRPTIVVHLLSFYDMAEIEADTAGQALQRIWSAVAFDPEALPEATPPRGWSGLSANPFTFEPGERPIELRYFTYPVGQRPHPTRTSPELTTLGGFTWAVQLGYDEDTRTLRLAAVEKPIAAPVFRGGDAVTQYQAAVAGTTTRDAVIDITNFTRAAMRRDNFAGGARPVFVDRPQMQD